MSIPIQLRSMESPHGTLEIFCLPYSRSKRSDCLVFESVLIVVGVGIFLANLKSRSPLRREPVHSRPGQSMISLLRAVDIHFKSNIF